MSKLTHFNEAGEAEMVEQFDGGAYGEEARIESHGGG